MSRYFVSSRNNPPFFPLQLPHHRSVGNYGICRCECEQKKETGGLYFFLFFEVQKSTRREKGEEGKLKNRRQHLCCHFSFDILGIGDSRQCSRKQNLATCRSGKKKKKWEREREKIQKEKYSLPLLYFWPPSLFSFISNKIKIINYIFLGEIGLKFISNLNNPILTFYDKAEKGVDWGRGNCPHCPQKKLTWEIAGGFCDKISLFFSLSLWSRVAPNWWNCFDVLVVALSLARVPGASILRLLRILRLLKMVDELKSLQASALKFLSLTFALPFEVSSTKSIAFARTTFGWNIRWLSLSPPFFSSAVADNWDLVLDASADIHLRSSVVGVLLLQHHRWNCLQCTSQRPTVWQFSRHSGRSRLWSPSNNFTAPWSQGLGGIERKREIERGDMKKERTRGKKKERWGKENVVKRVNVLEAKQAWRRKIFRP